jgi:hypothetical protein
MHSSYDSEESRSSSEEEEVDLGNNSLIASSSSFGSESTQEEYEVVGTNSDSLSGDLDDAIDAEEVEVVSENSEDSDEGDEVDRESEPILVEEEKETAPVASAATVIMLQHVIVRTEDAAAQHEEVENVSLGADECQRKTRSFRHFRRYKNEPSTSIQGVKRRLSPRRPLVSALSMKKSKERHRDQYSASLHVDSREDTEENTDPAVGTHKSPPKLKSHRGSQQFLASAIAMKKSREQEDEESNASNDNDSREGTEAFTEDPDYVASINSSRCQTNGEWSKLANPALSLAPSDLSQEGTVDYPESIKSSKSAHSRRSLQFFNIFKRRRSGDAKSVKSKRDGKDEETTKTGKTNRSWFRRRKRKKTPKHENDFKSKRSFSLFRKPVSLVECQRNDAELQIAMRLRLRFYCICFSHGAAEIRLLL